MTYSVCKSKDLVAFFELVGIAADFTDYSGKLDTHDSLGSLWGKRVFAFSLHDIHSVQTKVLKLATVVLFDNVAKSSL
jgi:hypothetical protein